MQYNCNQHFVVSDKRSTFGTQSFKFPATTNKQVTCYGGQAGLRCRNWNLKFRILSVVCFLFFGIFAHGCTSSASKPYNRSYVITYAELTLLYEKEKMTNKLVDSLYQVKVKEFFEKKGLQQNDFKKEIDELSEDNAVWKMFIQDVTAAMDSLKSAQK